MMHIMMRMLLCLIKNFTENYEEHIIKIVNYLNNAICEAKKQKSTTVTLDAADEIRKFKQLLDEGLISQEEFIAKKKQLLGL